MFICQKKFLFLFFFKINFGGIRNRKILSFSFGFEKVSFGKKTKHKDIYFISNPPSSRNYTKNPRNKKEKKRIKLFLFKKRKIYVLYDISAVYICFDVSKGLVICW